MPRFFVSPQALLGTTVLLEGEQASHIKVLRLGCGDHVQLCDGQGMEACGTIVSLASGQVELQLEEREASRSEPKLRCSVYMGFPKADKF